VSPEQFRTLNDRIDRCCEARDRDPASLERSVNLAFMLSVDAEAAARADVALDAMWGEQAERIRGGALSGTPDQAVERVARYVAAGAQGVNVALRAPWDPGALDIYLDRVIPELRKEFGQPLSV
jgi:alkanesulfonate monooxygenase SsuD/methylene tetrahydromethanopterin reductase-like flavin-dependent oxidoreductase (luciferase family)